MSTLSETAILNMLNERSLPTWLSYIGHDGRSEGINIRVSESKITSLSREKYLNCHQSGGPSKLFKRSIRAPSRRTIRDQFETVTCVLLQTHHPPARTPRACVSQA